MLSLVMISTLLGARLTGEMPDIQSCVVIALLDYTFFNCMHHTKTCNVSKHVQTEQNINNQPLKEVMATSAYSALKVTLLQ